MVACTVVSTEFERCVRCDVDLCVTSVEVPVSVYGLMHLVAYYSSYVRLARAVMWILRLVRALHWRAIHSAATIRLRSVCYPEDGLGPHELAWTRTHLVRFVQCDMFGHVYEYIKKIRLLDGL